MLLNIGSLWLVIKHEQPSKYEKKKNTSANKSSLPVQNLTFIHKQKKTEQKIARQRFLPCYSIFDLTTGNKTRAAIIIRTLKKKTSVLVMLHKQKLTLLVIYRNREQKHFARWADKITLLFQRAKVYFYFFLITSSVGNPTSIFFFQNRVSRAEAILSYGVHVRLKLCLSIRRIKESWFLSFVLNFDEVSRNQ